MAWSVHDGGIILMANMKGNYRNNERKRNET